ncbi:hypothetical protein [Nonlabens ponticola]|uniref:DUF1579 domain-containing protein n=1 Tax=Nonlabens ponticola TaxID=2496866 RepID=A0A3S9MUT0_9FLAO|nr:hypothetical protein [Nonlabens ponticola]AZQ42931.1 hypothetical protein EJ995_01280 [Nonlabens ponticola]
MKMTLAFAFLFIVITISFSQTLTVEDYGEILSDSNRLVPANIQKIVDSNNSLDVFVGHWSAVHSRKKFDVFISKNTINNGIFDEIDALILDYRIRDENDNLIIDTRQTGNAVLSGIGYSLFPDGSYSFFYNRRECEANYEWGILLETEQLTNRKTLYLELMLLESLWITGDECSNGAIEPYFPVNTGLNFVRQ